MKTWMWIVLCTIALGIGVLGGRVLTPPSERVITMRAEVQARPAAVIPMPRTILEDVRQAWGIQGKLSCYTEGFR